MPIDVGCPKCAGRLKAPDSAAGKRAKCPRCGATVDVPAVAAPAEQAAPLDWSHPFDAPALPADAGDPSAAADGAQQQARPPQGKGAADRASNTPGSPAFDPYYKWLGIPPTEQPANFYRLLGLANFEPDADVIQAAADRQMAHVRTYQTGTHSALSQMILNELAKARLCLLTPDRKAAYDADLPREPEAKADVAESGAEEPAWQDFSAPQTPAEPSPMASPAVRRKPRRLLPALGVAAGVLGIVALGLALALRSERENPPPATLASATPPAEPQQAANPPADSAAANAGQSPPTVAPAPVELPRPDVVPKTVVPAPQPAPPLDPVPVAPPAALGPTRPDLAGLLPPKVISDNPVVEATPSKKTKPRRPAVEREETLADRTKMAFKSGDKERFEALLKSAADADSEAIDASFALGLYYALVADKPAAADRRFRECSDRLKARVKGDADRDRELAIVQANLGLAKLQQRKFTDAIAEWRRATSHTQSVPECTKNVGKLASICSVDTCNLPKQVKTSAARLATQLAGPKGNKDGWHYASLPGALEFFPQIELEDHHCIFCDDKKFVDCPVRGCNGGRVTKTRDSVVAANRATGDRIIQSNEYQAPCSFCHGVGHIPCWGCSAGSKSKSKR